ncbi:MAG: hypothetical protein CL927_01805 [Deltaproteobacteria bacterium]|nr:hypothetical protein [Deltaproteobacteria bacterium]HCH66508.1 hypothetical protein [Deltaproteobacteria bacterium]
MGRRNGGSGAALPEKVCETCGRRFSWRKKWARDWEAVRYCSKRCRGTRGQGAEVDGQLLEVLAARPGRRWTALTPVSIGLSVAPETLRQAARRLATQGRVELGVGGRVVDPTAARGAVEVRLSGTTQRR